MATEANAGSGGSTPRLASAVLTVASGVAFGVVAMTGLVAAVVFPAMRDLDPTSPAYESYDGPHWSLIGGVVAERVFHIGFVVVGVALGLASVAVGVLSVARGAGRIPVVRIGLCIAALGLFVTHAGWLQPRMDRAASAYRDAAALGDNPAANEAKSKFDAMHPTASKLIQGTTVASLALFVTSAWVGAGRPGTTGGGQ